MTKVEIDNLVSEITTLLRDIIRIESLSGKEVKRADFLFNYLESNNITTKKVGNNLYCTQPHFNKSYKTLIINSHIDTVAPVSGYSFDPFNPPLNEEKIYGLGSNDAGGALASMIVAFKELYRVDLGYNLVLAISCEEENSGKGGIELLMLELEKEIRVDCAIVGEPTQMKAAIAERGLLVLDCEVMGVSGHAARSEGVNAIYKAIEEIQKIKSIKFDKISPQMGEVNLNITQINAGIQHNVIPDICKFVVDIRPTDCYSNQEIIDLIRGQIKCEIHPRSLHNRSSATPQNHHLLKCAQALGIELYSSPTTSDWMRLKVPAIKMGPGDSSRSHRADEYILLNEIESGITGYIKFLLNLKF